MYERIGNLHMHTTYSDGTASHRELAEMAAAAGLDFLVVTDHNTYPTQHAGWYGRVLLLVGEELNAPERGHENHFLAIGAGEDLAPFAADTTSLVARVRELGGAGFIAHPIEHSGALAHEPEINWVRWDLSGYDGLEIWNYMSEFKAHVTSVPRALLYAFYPKLAIRGPFPETLALWDRLLAQRPTPAIGGSDAHGTVYRMGPLKRRIFPYPHLFRAVNTHLLLADDWTGDAAPDGAQVTAALRAGRAFVAYDGLAPARGFTFTAEHSGVSYTLGDSLSADSPIRWRIRTPASARLRLLRDGRPVAETIGAALDHAASEPGVYRVEAYRRYAGRERGWIFANPIYVTP
ncbi:MAG: CehA/McbA family metallohydrolase [Anaerolineae bacterium]